MAYLRVTLADLMAIRLLFGIGFVSLQNAHAFWASARLSIDISSVSIAPAGQETRR
jgi:hypothetical protein